MSTNWQASGLTVEQGSIPMGQDDDRPVAFDLTEQLAEAESPENPTARLWLLGVNADPETEFADGLVGAPTIDVNIVSQRVSGLTKGRVYRLVITHGATGNRRSAEVFLPCVS